MLKSILFSLLMIITFSTVAQDAQITFVKEDLAVAQDKAKSMDKLIFVDAYTTWCGPCKMMDRNTFNNKSVADFYNENFVNLKLDMEKGKGPAFALEHEVRGYPSLLFLNAGGELVHRALGYQNADQFLLLGKSAVNPDKQVITLQRRFEAGDRDKTFLSNYADALTMAGMEGYEEVTKAYLDQEKNWNTPENIKFLFDYSVASADSELFQYMMANRALFEKELTAEKVESKVSYAANMDARKSKLNSTDKEAVIDHFKKYFPQSARAKGMSYYMQNLMYAKGEVNEEKYLSEVQLYMATNPELSSQGYNSHAWRIYELSDDNAILSQAINWIETSIEMEENSYNTDTKAALLYKLGKKKEALAAAELSVKLAQEEGNDPNATMELIEKIKELK